MIRRNIWQLFGWVIWLGLLSPAFAQHEKKVSRPFQYEGYSQPTHKSYVRESCFVEMPDSVKLAIDILRPTVGPPITESPVVCIMTPYNRSFLAPKMNPATKLLTAALGFGWGPEFFVPAFLDGAELLLKHGYTLVVADMRGTGASFGTQLPLMPSLGADGKHLVDWIADQPWCDGNVGMMGPSYLGWIQFLTAANRPEALKCIMPEVMAFNVYTAGDRPGGILAQRWVKGFSHQLNGYNLNIFEWRKGLIPSLPVVDEDQDGDLQDEWPGLDWTIVDSTFAPTYKDKDTSHRIYLAATREHLDNVLIERLMDSALQYYDSRMPAPYDHLQIKHTNPGYYADQIAKSGIPVYLVGGWFDGFITGTTVFYSTLAETNPVKMLIGPRHHVTVTTAYRKYLDYKGDYDQQLAIEQLRFFDRYLKGINNNIDVEPPVNLYVMHQGWRAESTWPVPRAKEETLFLGRNRELIPTPGPADETAYQVDYGTTSSYGKDSLNRWIMYRFNRKEVMDRTQMDQRCLTFDTPVLNDSTEVTGHPIVNLWLSSDQAYADVYVYLCDVDPSGRSLYVTEGQLRAGWAGLYPPDEQVDGKIQVKPALPWHGFGESQWQEAILAGGKKVQLTFDLLPTSYVFKPGHKIRIAIAGADYHNFELHPKLCPDQQLGNCVASHWEIAHGSLYPSGITLPIIPKQPPLDPILRR